MIVSDQQKIIIAIDGHSSSGKSTLAKDIAKKLNYKYIDTGAMYRAITLYFLDNNIKLTDLDEIENSLKDINIDFDKLTNHTLLNHKIVEQEIRELNVSNYVSIVASVKSVRTFLVAQQRMFGKEKGLVMDGRDIGTVVFPDAAIKFFVTADLDERINRRFNEMKKGENSIDFDEVKENLLLRDRIDTTRTESPLKKADDAVEINNTFLNREQQLEFAMDHILNKFPEIELVNR